jgi:single-strand DNA-binding protein
MNKIFIIGNLTRDVEMKQTPSGVNVGRLTVAVSRDYPNAEGQKDTDFFSVIAWRNLATNCDKWLTKGDKVAVVGRVEQRKYEDQNGEKRVATEIIADNIEFLTPKTQDDETLTIRRRVEVENRSESQEPRQVRLEEIKDNQLPF